jgi:hypothetical protein
LSIRSLAAGIVIGVSITAAVGIAYANIPDSSGVLHACYQNVTSPTKPVKLLNTSQKATCPSGWTAVSWNQHGPVGPPGTGVADRARTSSFVIPLNNSAPVTIPFNAGESWTQGASEVDSFVAWMTYTIPQTCNGEAAVPGTNLADVVLLIDGERSAEAVVDAPPGSQPGETVTAQIELINQLIIPNGSDTPLNLPEPGTATTHSFSGSEVYGGCSDTTTSVQHLAVDVEGTS